MQRLKVCKMWPWLFFICFTGRGASVSVVLPEHLRVDVNEPNNPEDSADHRTTLGSLLTSMHLNTVWKPSEYSTTLLPLHPNHQHHLLNPPAERMRSGPAPPAQRTLFLASAPPVLNGLWCSSHTYTQEAVCLFGYYIQCVCCWSSEYYNSINMTFKLLKCLRAVTNTKALNYCIHITIKENLVRK